MAEPREIRPPDGLARWRAKFELADHRGASIWNAQICGSLILQCFQHLNIIWDRLLSRRNWWSNDGKRATNGRQNSESTFEELMRRPRALRNSMAGLQNRSTGVFQLQYIGKDRIAIKSNTCCSSYIGRQLSRSPSCSILSHWVNILWVYQRANGK